MRAPHLRSPALLSLAVALAAPAGAQQTRTLVDISHLSPNEHRVAGFVLSRPQFIGIMAIGAAPWGSSENAWWGRDDEQESWPAAAWIIETRSRAVVWDLREGPTDRLPKGLRRFTGPIRLPAGLYEAHVASYVEGSGFERDGSFDRFALHVTGPGRPARRRELKEAVDAFREFAIATLAPDTADIARVGFELPRPTDVEVIATGELRQGRGYDYGWVQRADTREVLWRLEYGNTVPAGGSRKNRMAHDTLHLAAGRYVATFVNDGDHHPGGWTAVPPWDPALWGLTLRVGDEATRRSVKHFRWQPVPDGQTITALVGIGNNELRSQGFFLKKPADVRVYALGECSSLDGDVDDGGWLMDLARQRRAWEMRCSQTVPAGGAAKNRMVDTLLHLEPGNYRLFYKSDGSHSSKGWNSAPPAEPRYWGATLFLPQGRPTPDLVGPPERDTTGVIAEVIRVRNSRKTRRYFSLEAPTAVRIVALGEGTGGRMHDFGWIENGKTGDQVWRMEYPSTRPAGGAEKNRLVDSTLTLQPGRYVLHYETDDSHAFGAWNADPPDDPESWGITVRKAP